MRILVVDDETPARERISQLVDSLGPDYQVVGEAAEGDEALDFCAEVPVDLVLLDVQMPGMDGLECASHLAKLDPPPAVILVTAYTEYALEAFAHKVQDYLVKPVRLERLRESLERIKIPTRPQRETMGVSTTSRPPHREHLSAHFRGGVKTVAVSEILYLLAEHKYVTVRHTGGELLLDESLKSLEEEFADQFMRIHRNALVSRKRLTGLHKAPDGSTLITLDGCTDQLPISRRHLPEVRRWLRAGKGR
ncbi:LytTR family DNA-binding domain-containing protein [Thioalkalicoccus limnaeus]|uniref:LytTR family DNA-binding domain-containing protein n=1 Tax=Thioalkalicoccus limnaeus TaxID=120681 RepID=A0ABV4BCZ4_9GAMM